MSVLSRWIDVIVPILAVACLAAWAASSPAFATDGGWIARDQQILRLQATLDRMRGQDSAGGWPAIAAGPSLRMSAADPRVPALRRRLGAADGGSQFDLSLHRAVRAFQLSHGLPADGVVGEQTRAALNVPLAARLAEIESNLARWRQQPADPAGRYILVNIAFMELYAVNGGQVAFAARVIVGKRTSQTPLFETAVRGIDFSP
ncbi:MAG: peptidoglycan-binding protein, partial [Acetobacteraceae bacterium]|nr:peptidoglycan-binding protein [Acetobacteraceae bacterium]